MEHENQDDNPYMTVNSDWSFTMDGHVCVATSPENDNYRITRLITWI